MKAAYSKVIASYPSQCIRLLQSIGAQDNGNPKWAIKESYEGRPAAAKKETPAQKQKQARTATTAARPMHNIGHDTPPRQSTSTPDPRNPYIKAITNYIKCDGRSSRQDFWLYILIVFATNIGASILDRLLWGDVVGPLLLASSLFHFLPSIAAIVRRLHDTGRSGGWFFLSLIPIIGSLPLIVMLCMPPTLRPNRYGPPPPRSADLAVERGTSGSSDPLVQLERLASLKSAGAISDEEFNSMKQQIFAG